MITNFKLFENKDKEDITVKEIINEIILENIDDLIYIANEYNIVGDWNDEDHDHSFYNLLLAISHNRDFTINDYRFLLSKDIDVNKKMNDDYQYHHLNKNYRHERINLKGANALLLSCIYQKKTRILRALIDAGADWKILVNGQDMFYYLDQTREEIILNTYPEIKAWKNKKDNVKKFKI